MFKSLTVNLIAQARDLYISYKALWLYILYMCCSMAAVRIKDLFIFFLLKMYLLQHDLHLLQHDFSIFCLQILVSYSKLE